MTARIIGADSAPHEKQMRRLAEFCGLDEIRYVNHGNKEEYVLSKSGVEQKIFACGNRYDGGFLVVETACLEAGVEAMSDGGATV